MKRRWLVSFALPLASVAPGGTSARSYDPSLATQHQTASSADLVPQDATARQALARNLAFDATLFGTSAVLQYRQMYDQAVAPGGSGFNAFAHARTLAGPDFAAFKTPNADTLYSNAWLDLTGGPVVITVPASGRRYYTLNFLDIYGNATNISARTHGNAGGRHLIATTDWQGRVPAGTKLFRVATPYMWILMRIAVGDARDTVAAVALQDRFRIDAPPRSALATPPLFFPAPGGEDAVDFLRVVDWVVRANGHPAAEDALVARYRTIGIAADTPYDDVVGDPAIRAGIAEGYREAREVIAASLQQRAQSSSQWGFARDVGRFGSNYLLRSTINTLGTGGNVRDENGTFITFKDSAGASLDGSRKAYRLLLDPLPPGRYFWSVTLYDARTKQLNPNPLNRYLINAQTTGLIRTASGGIPIEVRADRPTAAAVNWLPAPNGPFYLVVRAQGPAPEVVDGRWRPNPVTPIAAERRP